jgi:D-3-phosphoglycerate dehydrogenase
MKVIAYDPFLSAEKAESLNIEKVELDDLLKRADFITLHTPLNDSTRYILNKESLAKAKKGVRIINCARGGLIQEDDLKAALESGQVAGVALDVFEVEPATNSPLFGMEQVICTPHLGASTTEAQENVAIQVAEQMAAYLNTGAVSNALNIPSVTAEEAKKLRPYLLLAEQLGSFTGQITESSLKEITIEYQGAIGKLNCKPMTAVALQGILTPLVDSVNMVNAPVIAQERGIVVTEVKREQTSDYQTLIRIIVTTEKQTRDVAGTLFAGQPRIVEVNGVKLEAGLGETMIYVNNEDKPGLVGNLGKILGEAQINIANFHLGRNDARQDAIALVAVDHAVDAETLKKIADLPSVKQAKILHF